MAKIKTALCVLLILFIGCAGWLETPSPRVIEEEIEVISYPKGAKIEVDNDYRGEAPLKLKAHYYEGNRFLSRTIVINAIPTRPGHCTQSKVLVWGDPIPKKLFFDMRLCTPNPSVDVNVR